MKNVRSMNMNAMMKSDVYVYNGKEFEMNYSTDISISKKMNFVSYVVSTIVGDGYYYPMLRDMIFDFQLLNFFSDVDTGIDEDTDNVFDEIESFLDNTNAVDVIKSNINFNVLIELNDAVDKAIEYKTGIHPSLISDAIVSLLNTVESKFSDIDVDSMADMAKVFSKMQGDITPDKMLSAYANSDLFKQIHNSVVNSQEDRDVKMSNIINADNGSNNISLVD